MWCIILFSVSREKSDKEIMREIQAIMRQIASSITYLPCLDETCKQLCTPMNLCLWIFFFFWAILSFQLNNVYSLFVVCAGVFDVLAYTDKDVGVPFTWIESDPKLIANPQMVKLHSFDTKVSSVFRLLVLIGFS